MDSPPFLSSLLKQKGKGDLFGDYLSGTNGSITSYEDMPAGGSINGDSLLRSTSRGAVMQALQNLQDKIQRLELERSDAESDMRQLASETSQFRQMLAKDEERLSDAEEPKQARPRRRETPRTAAKPPPSRAAAKPPPTPPNSTELALASAETRCTILEKQLSYMRTLLESAERDRNEAQRRSRTRGEQLLAWRQEAEAQLKGLEEELRTERRRNRQLSESAVALGRSLEREEEEEEEAATPCQAATSTPARKSAPKPPPFVVGRSTAPSHNVHANLQAALGALNRTGSRRQRQARDRLVDSQLQQDVAVVLEELVAEFDALCADHQALVARLAAADDAAEKTRLQQRLADLVARMEVKGQQIGRLRSAAVSRPDAPQWTESGRERSLHLLQSARRWQNDAWR